MTGDGETAGEIFDMVVLATGQKPGETFPALCRAGRRGDGGRRPARCGTYPKPCSRPRPPPEPSSRQLRGRGIVPRRSDPVDAAARSEKVFEQAPRVQRGLLRYPGRRGGRARPRAGLWKRPGAWRAA
ncbi:MAG: hypothetical protein MZU91_14630 [Desulfosudis oleivorans]|nr:hypothetical protein [Desulfosudis oleivorans]